jgi:hypothetical protein
MLSVELILWGDKDQNYGWDFSGRWFAQMLPPLSVQHERRTVSVEHYFPLERKETIVNLLSGFFSNPQLKLFFTVHNL